MKSALFVLIIQILVQYSTQQRIDKPRGPWRLAFKAVSGKWDTNAIREPSFWDLFTSTSTYSSANPVQDSRDFTTSSDHYKSSIVEDWENNYISVQAIKLSFFKNNDERAYIVFDGMKTTKTTWFKCDNILYSSYTDLPDSSLGDTCPGQTSTGFPLTLMKLSFLQAPCPMTTGWILTADTDLAFSICSTYAPSDRTSTGFPLTIMKLSFLQAPCPITTGWILTADTDLPFSICSSYAPSDGSIPKPYFKYSSGSGLADMTTGLETADSIAIFFQVWDLAFKGIRGIQPIDSSLKNLTGLFLSDTITENDNSNYTIRNLEYVTAVQLNGIAPTYKSGVIDLWEEYFIETAKFSMIDNSEELAYVIFNATDTTKVSWFAKDNILYSSYGSELDNNASLEICAIEGDSFRHWQIQTLADESGCTDTEQLGWMLVKEPRNNGSCGWDVADKKPYFRFNPGSTPTNPSNFESADVMAVFVHGWRMVFKVASGVQHPSITSVYNLWTQSGAFNEGGTGATDVTTGSPYFKSSMVDQWDQKFIYAVKLAAYKNGQEVFHAVFDATSCHNKLDWFSCDRLLYTSVDGFNASSTSQNFYNCTVDSSPYRFLLGRSPDCGSVSFTGVFGILDIDDGCTSRTDLPAVFYSDVFDDVISDSSAAREADAFAIFFDMENCYNGLCQNGGTCQDIGGYYRCFCNGSYYGDMCLNLDGSYSTWSEWSTCTVTCDNGTVYRNRTCQGTQGDGVCTGDSSETDVCALSPCPVDGVFSEWSIWTSCTLTCGSGTQSRSRTCSNPEPQYGGSNCTDDFSQTIDCNTQNCPVDGGLTEWGEWGACTHTCGTGQEQRTRTCTNPIPQFGGSDCTGPLEESQDCNTSPCPIDGGFSIWSSWDTCTVTCGTGSQSRSRTCDNPAPQHGGQDCVGNAIESQECNTNPCPIDGGLTDWSEWTDCTVSCGTGNQTRSRSCTNPEPQFGGSDCTGDTVESRDCNTQNCPVDGGLTQWSVWDTCTVTCGTGSQSRSRSCSDPEPQHGGQNCSGTLIETQDCNTQQCPIDGGFTDWSDWTDCTVSCGTGNQTRSRSCTNPEPQFGGSDCTGDTVESRDCNTQHCPVDGGLTQWSVWDTCTVTCGTGSQSRSRSCTYPEPQHGGQNCSGALLETQDCNTQQCPIDGGFTDWSGWTDCTVSCGTGNQTRSRSCTNPEAQFGGSDCTGDTVESRDCNTQHCPVDGGLTQWSVWDTCTVTCGTGSQSRSRSCTDPEPQHGGQNCSGDLLETQDCNTQQCPIDGGLTDWSEWTDCTVSCGTGNQTRSRSCINPEPQFGGAGCEGETSEAQYCNTQHCPVDGGLTTWSDWGICTLTCGTGSQSRSRSCSNPVPQHGGVDCVGSTSETQDCNTDPCPIDGGLSEWTSWDACTVTCGTGGQSRSRSCTDPEPQHGGAECVGSTSETQDCNTDPCPIDGGFTEWTSWGACTATCGTGNQTRSRSCSNPPPQHGGSDCEGDTTESQDCNTQPCPVHGGLTEWSLWGTCTLTCGTGSQTRTRTCTNPTPQHGGDDCIGDLAETQDCNTTPCPIDGGFSTWSVWTSCNVSCGGGQQSRVRTCTDPEPQHGGSDCQGDLVEHQDCNTDNCPIDGGLSEWSAWGSCSTSCDIGNQTRSRSCSNPSPQFGGQECTEPLSEQQTCNIPNCEIDGGWSAWTAWSSCTETCGSGSRTRTRTCSNPAPEFGGSNCSGDGLETEDCNNQSCPVDGGFTAWSIWDECSVSCDGGTQTRHRNCTNPEPQYGGADCTGETTESQSCNQQNCPECTTTCGSGIQFRHRNCTEPEPQYGGDDCTGDTIENQACNTQNCPVDGGYSDWGSWSVCTVTCDGGVQERSRDCTDPEPAHGGNNCTGDTTETRDCNEEPCPVDGGYTDWSEWGSCTVTCGTGSQERTRNCTNPSPQFGRLDCPGDSTEQQQCTENPCPVDGGFNDWSEWSDCSLTCGGGSQTRYRNCTNPEPQFGGQACEGSDTESADCNTSPCSVGDVFTDWSNWTECTLTCGTGTQTRERTCVSGNCEGATEDTRNCNTQLCPADGGFSDWSEWSECSVTCDQGSQTRSRTCSNPVPLYGGQDCVGLTDEVQNCLVVSCPVDGGFSNWSEWTSCSVTCDGGVASRDRSCTDPVPQHGGNDCDGNTTETVECNTDPCPVDGDYADWAPWSMCTVTCGTGSRNRSRSCTDPSPEHGGSGCSGLNHETESCNTQPCPIDGGWTTWSEWEECTVSCGTEYRNRTRSCTNPIPAHGGDDCLGSDLETDSCNTQPCPIDGDWTTWSEWNECTVTCGTGNRNRSRSCTNPAPEQGGDNCSGSDQETVSCNTEPCPVDGVFTPWSEWDACTVTCGSGSRNRSRSCTNPTPAHGGVDCSDSDQDTESCNSQPCPIDGAWAAWSDWAACTVTCGTGNRNRSRSCDNPIPEHGGSDCPGLDHDNETCNTQPCPIDGGFSTWSEWDECTVTCGTGSRNRSRSCDNPTPEHGGSDCTGQIHEAESCNTQPCPVDGDWATWSKWEECSVTCGSGIMNRSRSCTNPTPENGGVDCSGPNNETESCNTQPCPIDGGWTTWYEWDECTVSCGAGSRNRSRSCTNPMPNHDGIDCSGSDFETESCNTQACPIDGVWTTWLEWGDCTVSCGTGNRNRSRACTNPAPEYGGDDCSGLDHETESCNTQSCPIDGGFSTWSEWDECTVTCGTGGRNRSRSCDNPTPEHGGFDCSGLNHETESCNTQPCPIDGGWTTWSEWEACTVSCGTGSRNRSRSCTDPIPEHDGSDCSGIYDESESCNTQPCPIAGGLTSWSEWEACSVTCGAGLQSRSRSCTNPEPQYGGSDCDGPLSDEQSCNTQPCPVDGGFSDWTGWTTCNVTCGGGGQMRSRDCTNPAPLHGGNDCVGTVEEYQDCNANPCPVDGGFTDWSEWTTCSQTCGVGSQIRFRTCSDPIPQYGGQDCLGDMTEIQSCMLLDCPVDGAWSVWSVWGECSKSCETGVQYRTRSCSNPIPEYGGLQCAGDDQETQTCNDFPCPIDGGFTAWSAWQECTKTCDTGTQIRLRECTNPIPQYNGQDCVGSNYETRECLTIYCPVEGYLTEWSSWTECLVSCAGGSQTRNRSCVGPFHGGADCTGVLTEEAICNTNPCPVDGYWLTWSEWTVCTATCNGGITLRVRQCVEPQHGGDDCGGVSQEISVCEEGPCPTVDGGWSDWSVWTDCSQSCGTGFRTRTRTCTDPAPQWGGEECTGNDTDTTNCVVAHCPVDGLWSSWVSWSSCFNMTRDDCTSECNCGYGMSARVRTCTNPAPENGGEVCTGEDNQVQNCFVPCLTVQCDADHPEYCHVIAPPTPRTGKYSGAACLYGSKMCIALLLLLYFSVTSLVKQTMFINEIHQNISYFQYICCIPIYNQSDWPRHTSNSRIKTSSNSRIKIVVEYDH